MNRWTQANVALAACALVLLAVDRWSSPRRPPP